jgi:tetratricopeptide (TPR) repeat protein
MRTPLVTLGAALAVATAVAAQMPKTPSPAAVEANKHYEQGWSAIRAQEWDIAKGQFERAIESDPNFALAYYSLGRAEMGLRDYDAAIAAYTKCRDVYLNGGRRQFQSQLELRQYLTDRILEYRAALAQAQNQAALTRGTVQSQSQSQSQNLYIRDLQTQIQRLEEMRNRTGNNTMDVEVPYYVPMALGAAYQRAGRLQDAEREYKTALAANAQSGETHNNLAVLYLTLGRYEEADAEVKAAEKTGFRVAEELKGDIRQRKSIR